MTEMFTSRRRAEMLDMLVTLFQADRNIAGLVLVGSGAGERADRYSGIDLLVVIAHGAVFPSVYRKWRDRLRDLLPVLYQFEAVNRIDEAIYSLMLQDYLEINLYFTPFKLLSADSTPWQVIFDQTETGDIEPTLERTYRKERVLAPTREYQQIMSSIWQPIIKCVTALNRSELWRALHMLDLLRDRTIQLAAMNYNIDTRNYSEVDRLPEMLLVKLRHTLPTNVETVAIRRALAHTLQIFYQQATMFEKQVNLELVETLRQTMSPYVEAYS